MVDHILNPNAWYPVPGENEPEWASGGTNVGVRYMAFDAAGTEAAQYKLAAVDYTSGNLTLTIRWKAATATSGDVVWGGSIIAYTPNTDTGDIEADAWATETTSTDTALATTAGRLMTVNVTISNLDSLAADDELWVRLRRLGGNGSDTMAGDAEVVGVILSYT